MPLMKVNRIVDNVVEKAGSLYNSLKQAESKDENTLVNNYLDPFLKSDKKEVKDAATVLLGHFKSYLLCKQHLKTISELTPEQYNSQEAKEKLQLTMQIADVFVGDGQNSGFAKALNDFNVATGFKESNEKAFYQLTDMAGFGEIIAMSIEDLAIEERKREAVSRQRDADELDTAISAYEDNTIDMLSFIVANRAEAPSQAEAEIINAKDTYNDSKEKLKKGKATLDALKSEQETLEVAKRDLDRKLEEIGNSIVRQDKEKENYQQEIRRITSEKSTLIDENATYYKNIRAINENINLIKQKKDENNLARNNQIEENRKASERIENEKQAKLNELKEAQNQIAKIEAERENDLNIDAINDFTRQLFDPTITNQDLTNLSDRIMSEAGKKNGKLEFDKDTNEQRKKEYEKKLADYENKLADNKKALTSVADSVSNGDRILSFFEDGTDSYLKQFIAFGYKNRENYQKDLKEYNQNLKKEPNKKHKEPYLKEDPIFTLYADFAEKYGKKQAYDKFKDICEKSIQLKDIWEEAEGMQENLDRLKRDSGTREASVRAYKKFLDAQGRSDEYKDLTDDEIMTVDRFGKYLYFHEERWMETDEKGRAELMKKGNGIIYLDQHTIALDKEGNVLFKDKSKASEIINVKGAIASEIEDYIEQQLLKEKAEAEKKPKRGNILTNFFGGRSNKVSIAEAGKIAIPQELLTKAYNSSKEITQERNTGLNRDLQLPDFDAYKKMAERAKECEKNNIKFEPGQMILENFKQELAKEYKVFDDKIEKPAEPQYIDVESQEKDIQLLRDKNARIINEKKRRIAIEELKQGLLTEEQIKERYDVDLKVEGKFDEIDKELDEQIKAEEQKILAEQAKIDSKNNDIKRKDTAIEELNNKIQQKDDRKEELQNEIDEVNNRWSKKDEQSKELEYKIKTEGENIKKEGARFIKAENDIKVYTELDKKNKKLTGDYNKINTALDVYKNRYSNIKQFVPDTRVQRCLNKVNLLLARQDNNKGSHSNTPEFTRMVNALTGIKTAIEENPKDVRKISEELTKAKNAAKAYYDEKMKHGRTWGTKLRHTRLNYANEIFQWTGNMAKNIVKECKNTDPSQKELNILKFKSDTLRKPSEIGNYVQEAQRAKIDINKLDEQQKRIAEWNKTHGMGSL